ncbi:MAG: DUF4469 domain-containing protein [Treponema sp.]
MLNQQNYLRVSVCKSNVNKENPSYYPRVQRTSKISEEKLIEMVKAKIPYLEGATVEAVAKAMILTTLECVEKGCSVDFLGLGTLKLEGKGSIKVSEPVKKNLDGFFKKKDEAIEKEETISDKIEGSYEKDLPQIDKKSIEFRLQFIPSKAVRQHIKNHVEPSFITTKVRKPVIKTVEKVYSGGEGIPSIIKLKGEDLKLVGEGGSIHLKTNDEVIQIPRSSIIHNEPKTLMFISPVSLKDGKEYTIFLSTQYAMMGNRCTSLIRCCSKEFKFANLIASQLEKAG